MDYVIDQVWGARFVSQKDTQLRVVNEDWNNRICSGKSVTIGFTATGEPSVPTEVTINGNAVPQAP